MEHLKINQIVRTISVTHRFDKDCLLAINTSDVDNGIMGKGVLTPIAELKGQFKKTVQKDDILFSEIRPANRRFARVTEENCEDFVVSTKLMVLRKFNNDVDLDYFYYCLTNQPFLEILQRRAENRIGSFPQITFDLLSEYSFPIPSLQEQKAIAKCIANLDNKLILNRAINQNLEALAKQLYDYWFVQFDFPDENGRPYKSIGGGRIYNENLKRSIPIGWEVGTISNFVSVKRGTTITKAQTAEGLVKVVAAATDFSFWHNEANRTEYVITVSSSGANAGYINFWREPIYASDCSTIQGGSIEQTLYCYYWILHFQQILFNQQIGAAQPHVYPEHIGKIPIILPPKYLLDAIKDSLMYINEQQRILDCEISVLIKQRDELLPLLMNGQVSVNSDLSLLYYII